MYIEESQLREFITDAGLVSQKDFDFALDLSKKQNESVGNILISEGKLTEDDLRRMQAYLLGIPFVDLKGQKIPIEVLSLIPEPIARTHNVVAFKKDGDFLEVAMLDTDDLSSIDFIKKKTGYKILTRLTNLE